MSSIQLKIISHAQKQEYMTNNEETHYSIRIEPELTQMLEAAVLTALMFHVFKELNGDMKYIKTDLNWTPHEENVWDEKYVDEINGRLDFAEEKISEFKDKETIQTEI